LAISHQVNAIYSRANCVCEEKSNDAAALRATACKLRSAGFLLLPLLFARILVAQSAAADLILLHGHILTVDATDSVAQAVSIRKGMIVKVGTDAEVLEFAGEAPGIRVIDLHGHTATPGLIDTHAHISEGGVEELYGVKLSDAASVVEIVARVKAKAALVKPGEWITGSGWDEGKLAEHRYVTAADLDVVAPNNPVWLFQTTHHYGVANSAALKLANVTAATAAPAASTIDRDAKGNPTGVLKESPAFKLVTDHIPPTTLEQMRHGILYIQQVLHSEGMTAVKDPLILQTHWDAYKSLMDQGLLKERVCVLWSAGATMETARKALAEINTVPRLPATLGDDRLLSCGVKIFMDGSSGARTGWVYDNWFRNATTPDITSSGEGNRGYPQTDPAVYQKMVRLFHQNGVPVGTHAVGDRAMDWVVDTYALIEQEQPHPGLRHSIIHANLPTAHALDRMAAMQKKYDAGYPEMQPGFLWGLATSMQPATILNATSDWSPSRPFKHEAFSGPAARTTRLRRLPPTTAFGPPPPARPPKVPMACIPSEWPNLWTSTPLFAAIRHGDRARCFWRTRLAPLKRAKEPTSRSGTATSTLSPLIR
jgi:predicted amidohydrolase YtcJ